MNVTFSMFQNAAGTASDGSSGVQGTPSGTIPENLSGQSVGKANPFALLLSGQLRSASELGDSQGLSQLLATGKLPAALRQLLPQDGKALPDTEAANTTDEHDVKADPGKATLDLTAILDLPQGDATDSDQQTGQQGAADWTLNLLQLAMADLDKGADHKLSVDRQSSGDDQAILRVLQGAGLRADLDRAGVLLQHAAANAQPHTADTGDQTVASQSAALAADPGIKAPVDSQPKTAAVVQSTLQQPVGKQGWDQELGSRMVWMSRQDLQSAQLRLNPAHLGPLEVHLSVQQDQSANVSFLSNHAPVRDAVEAAIPRLREMLADNGFNLAGVDVSAHSQGQARDQHTAANHSQFAQADGGLDVNTSDDLARHVALGLVDYFA